MNGEQEMNRNGWLQENRLKDRYDRSLNYLRVSVTDRCNLNCRYCMTGGMLAPLRHKDVLRYEEILRLVRIGVKCGISKIRVTGGEPLVRKGIYPFLTELTRVPALEDVSLTTNGVLLADNAERIKAAGVRRLNISLDTLDRHRYSEITGFDAFDRVWRGIMRAWETGFHPIKINVVVLQGMNDRELPAFVDLTRTYPFHVRFIEYMPIGTGAGGPFATLASSVIRDRIRALGELTPIERGSYDGPAQRFRLAGAIGEIGFISPISNHFCDCCNRLRLTASGQLRPCLLSDHQIDIKTPLRKGLLDEDLADYFHQAAAFKARRHHLATCEGLQERVETGMSRIGG